MTPPKPYTDPDELPSDARMIDWVERRQAVVNPRYPGPTGWHLFVITGDNNGRIEAVEEYGPTWRAVVEAGMRRLT